MVIDARTNRLTLYGYLDRNYWPTIRAAAKLLLKRNPSGIIISGEGLTGCSEEGVHTFSDALSFIQRQSKRVVLIHIPPAVMEVLTRTPGLRSQLPLAADEAEAMRSLGLDDAKVDDDQAARQYHVLVPIWDGLDPGHVVEHAIHLTHDREGLLSLVYILVVPQTLALTAPMPEREAEAYQVLEDLGALVTQAHVHLESHVLRSRDLTSGVLKAAEEEAPHLMVLGIPRDDRRGVADDMLTQVLSRAKCEVMVARPRQVEVPQVNIKSGGGSPT